MNVVVFEPTAQVPEQSLPKQGAVSKGTFALFGGHATHFILPLHLRA